MRHIVLLLCVLGGYLTAYSQTKQNPELPSPIIFIYDASGSMWGQLQGKSKMEIASEVLATSINELPENQQLGLVAYGHREKGDCRDVETLVSMDNRSKEKIASEVKAIKPLGKTPLAYSAATVIDMLRKNGEQATIILITDGIESCDGNICDVVSEAKKEGIDFKLHIVGFGLKSNETEQLKCAAKAGDGNYYDAADAGGLSDVMTEVVTETVDKPKGNHGVYATKNGKAIDALVEAYKSGTSNKAGGTRTYRDTAYVYLPQETYDLKITPLENSKVSPITLTNIKTSNEEKTYSIVSFDGGKFAVLTTNNGEGWDSTVKVLDMDGKQVSGTRTYGRTKEIEVDPGTYNIKFQALNLDGLETNTIIENKTIVPGETTEVTHDFTSGVLEVVPMVGDTKIDCTTSVVPVGERTAVAYGRTYDRGIKWTINPGTYEVSVKAIGPHADRGTKSITVTIPKGETVSKTIQF
ncbi:MAG: VWA domain-containing protein [Flavobacteriales bacterium]|nr:VWA domain-containing protein [Flavobacteriales bacterium]